MLPLSYTKAAGYKLRTTDMPLQDCNVQYTGWLWQGNGMGYGWVSYGFGLAFFFPLLCFSHISAQVNPATCLALWVRGELGPGDFFALAAAECAGMFAGACLMWVGHLTGTHHSSITCKMLVLRGSRIRNHD